MSTLDCLTGIRAPSEPLDRIKLMKLLLVPFSFATHMHTELEQTLISDYEAYTRGLLEKISPEDLLASGFLQILPTDYTLRQFHFDAMKELHHKLLP